MRHLRPCYSLLRLLLPLLLLLPALQGNAQKKPVAKPDTAIVADTTRRFEDRVMQNLRELSERKTIMGKLLNSILVFDRKDEVLNLDAELIEREYERHNYKVVRNIRVISLDAFGYSINDTTRVPANWFEKTGNFFHARSKGSLIRNKLLFETDKTLEPLALVESERLLRQTDYILDARIIVNERTTTDDSLDVIVITKDVFSLGGSGSFTPSSGSGRITVRELNFLGLGHQPELTYRFNQEAPRPWEFAGRYSIENIGRSYITANIAYINENRYQERSAFLSRDFYATNTRYAGAVGVSRIEEQLLLPPANGDATPTFGTLSYTRRDAWFGRAFKFKSYNLGYEPRGRLILGVRVIDTKYHIVPTENFHSNQLYLGSIGYSVRKYYKDRYLFGFGRTEDIPTGGIVSVTTGYQDGAGTNRRYFGASAAFAQYRSHLGYLYGNVSWGSFLNDDTWEQGKLEVQSLYFTRLYERGNWKLRHYLQTRATFGLNRNPEELLTINNNDGLRGFNSEMLRGSKRLTLNYEANLYTPFSFLGFKLATLAFADVAWLSAGNKTSPLKNKPYTGFGLGLRFRNEYLSFSTIQILFSFYPRLPVNEDIRGFKVYEASRPYYDFTDFRFERPGVAEFR
ncbi:hypothetical protein H7F15_14875 [Pontibacter sp. Tf4]|uniref:hypothetical protein n=1 Tax=Pontibacter sp. Tf4 TaxID=2761620 RepID=UPI00162AA225|nr:hypothetical protein [Pontibacter sp. Tf4]MBB6612332.1 hypothetical protein [Pontibacter sp. Tf4]